MNSSRLPSTTRKTVPTVKSRRVKLKLQFGGKREGLESRLGNQIQAKNFNN